MPSTERRLVRLLEKGADAVAVACALGVSLQRARELIATIQPAAEQLPAHQPVPLLHALPETPLPAVVDPAAHQAGAADLPPEATPPASVKAGSPNRRRAPALGAAATADGTTAMPRIETPCDPPPPARPFCRAGDSGPALPLSPAVLDALGITLAGRP